MARLKLIFPEKILFTTNVAIRITDINYGNHLGNDSLVSIIHEARMQWLSKNNYSELDIDGASLIMSELAVEYKNESFYGDTLNIDIAMGNISSVSFEIFYNIKNQTGKLIAIAKTGMVCFDYKNRKVLSLPEKFRMFLQN